MKNAVVLSLYNGSQFIIEQLNSLKNQSKEIDELLIVDDCSSDNSYEICNSFIENNKLSNWKICKNDKNMGYAYNFIMNSYNLSADIVFFCDQDDIWDFEKVKLISEKFEEYTDALLICSDMDTFLSGNNKKNFSRKYMRSMINDNSVEKLKLSLNNFKLNRSGCTMAARRDFLISISKQWIKSWPHDDMVWKYALLQDGLYLYHRKLINRRLHGNNTSVNFNRSYDKRKNQIELYKKEMENLLIFCNENSLDGEEIIIRNLKCAKNRERFIKGHNIFRWFCLLKDRKLYQSNKGIFLDLYLFIKRR